MSKENPSTRLFRIVGYAGWLAALVLAAALIYLLPRLHLRLLQKPRSWPEMIEQKKASWSQPWKDQRPLWLFAGDSQVEMGDWYDLFQGAIAVRNCGMSMATIADVENLLSFVPDKRLDRLVLLCGVNDLFRDRETSAFLQDFASLIARAKTLAPADRIVVLAMLPVRKDPTSSSSKAFNQRIKDLNEKLRQLCQQMGCTFIDVNAALTDSNGYLDNALTFDGLHLNSLGYHRYSAALLEKMPK